MAEIKEIRPHGTTTLSVLQTRVSGSSAYIALGEKKVLYGAKTYFCHEEALQVMYQWAVKCEPPTDKKTNNWEQKYHLERP